MSTASRVRQTRTMGGDQLSADDAWTTLRRNGRLKLLRKAFVRFRYADGFSHARALAFQVCLAVVPFTVALLGLAATMHQRTLGDVLKHTLTKLTPRVLALYVAKSSTFGSTYGPLTGVLALLIWSNLSAVALFLGVSFSAQLEAVRAGAPQPTVDRDAKLDTTPVAREGRLA